MVCPVCHAPLNVDTPSSRTVVSCPVCGSGVTVPPPDRDVTSAGLFEDGSYGGTRLARRDQWLREATARMDWISSRCPAGVLLELGSATGELLRVAEDRGWKACGVETSVWAASEASKFVSTADVYAGFLSDWINDHPEMDIDVVAAFHVLEHVPDPGALVREIVSVLRPGGLVFIEVPNWESALARRAGLAWSFAAPNEHYCHFTPGSLTGLLRRCGLEIVTVRVATTKAYDPAPEWWRRKRLRQVARGHLLRSKDLLQVVARRPGHT